MEAIVFNMPLRIQLDKAGQKEALEILSHLNQVEPYMKEKQKEKAKPYKNFSPFQKTEEYEIKGGICDTITVSNSPDGIEIYSSYTKLFFETNECTPELVNIFTNIVKYMKTQDLPDVYQATGTIDTVKNPFA